MIGLDFGTTNSALARADRDVELARFSLLGNETTSYRSILYFSIDERVSAREAGVFSGPAAIEQYLEEGATGRFMQSLKSLLPSRTFESTQMLATVYDLETLIASIVEGIRREAERQFGALSGQRVVVGRPVEFVGASTPEDEAFALSRLRHALAIAGFDDVVFEYEPVGAAYAYSQRLDHDEVLLVADFGGGTSDFCVMRVGPGTLDLSAEQRLLATDGVGLAGDQFDARISQAIISPALGRGSDYWSWDKKRVPIPDWLYQRLASWHELSFLRAERPIATLREIATNAEHPEKLSAFLEVVERNLGYHLYDQVESAKRRLSDNAETILTFDETEVEIEAPVTREAFETWIADDVAAIDAAMRRALDKAGVSPSDVDRVFMTGGTAQTPAVRRLFVNAFGEDKLAGGEELTSVASGLALRSRDLS